MTFSILGAEPLRSSPINDNKAVAPARSIFDVEWALIPPVPRTCLFDLMAFFCSPNVWGLNGYVEHTWLSEKGSRVNSWHKERLCCVSGRGGETIRLKHPFHLEERLPPHILCDLMWLLWQYTHSAAFSRLACIVHTAFPLRRESTTKGSWSTNCLGTNLSVIIQIKREDRA